MPRNFLSAVAALALICGLPAAQAHSDHSHGSAAGHAHDHHHTAPHDGTLVSLGDEAAHLELVLDSAAGELTGYVLDGEAQKSIRVKQPEIALELSGRDVKTSLSITLKAVDNPLTGEKPGDSSEFRAEGDALKNLKKFTVVIKKLTVKGMPFENVRSPFPEGNH